MMKRLFFICVWVMFWWGCQDVKVGYLKSDSAEYVPNELVIRKILDPIEDELRIANEAPWVTQKIQGVLGTPPLLYEFVSVKALEGGDADLFADEILVRGGGVMQIPLYTQLPAGKYIVTLRVSNEGYSSLLPDVFTFIIK